MFGMTVLSMVACITTEAMVAMARGRLACERTAWTLASRHGTTAKICVEMLNRHFLNHLCWGV